MARKFSAPNGLKFFCYEQSIVNDDNFFSLSMVFFNVRKSILR